MELSSEIEMRLMYIHLHTQGLEALLGDNRPEDVGGHALAFVVSLSDYVEKTQTMFEDFCKSQKAKS